MKLKAIVLAFLAMPTAFCFGQTNVIYGYVGDYTGQPPGTRYTVTLKLLAPNPRWNGVTITRIDPMNVPVNLTNGYFAVTNLLAGYYQWNISGVNGTTFNKWVYPTTLGLVPLASLDNGNPDLIPPNPGTNYYTQAQVDALIAAAGSGTAGTTNGGGVIQGMLTNSAFSSTGSNVINNLVGALGNTTSATMTNVNNVFTGSVNATGGNTLTNNGAGYSIGADLRDGSGVASVTSSTRTLGDSTTTTRVDWENLKLYRGSGSSWTNSLDWGNKTFPNGWDGSTLTGIIYAGLSDAARQSITNAALQAAYEATNNLPAAAPTTNASLLTTGTLPDARLSSNVTKFGTNVVTSVVAGARASVTATTNASGITVTITADNQTNGYAETVTNIANSQIAALPAVNSTNIQLMLAANNLPTPMAWYNANNLAATNGPITMVTDSMGNTNNDLYQFLWNGGQTYYSSSIMNGNAGFGGGGNTVGNTWGFFTNTMFGATSKTNFVVFLVYRDPYFTDGSQAFGSGVSGRSSIRFSPWNPNSAAGQNNGGSCAYWGDDPGAGVYVYDRENNTVQIASLRSGTNGFAVWQNGILLNRTRQLPSGSTPAVYLTNGICLGGTFTLNSAGWWNGWIGECLIYTNSLNDYDVERVHAYLRRKFNLADNCVILAGASDIASTTAAPKSNVVVQTSKMLPGWEVANIAFSGMTAAQAFTNIANTLSYPAGFSGKKILYYYGGGNDDATGIANITNWLVQVARLCWTNNYALVLSTRYSATNAEAVYPTLRATYNDWIVTNAAAYGWYVSDFSSHPLVGPPGSYTNLNYFYYDGTHPNTNFFISIWPPVIASAVNAVGTVPVGTLIPPTGQYPSSQVASNGWSGALYSATNRLGNFNWANGISSNGLGVFKAWNSNGTIYIYPQ